MALIDFTFLFSCEDVPEENYAYEDHTIEENLDLNHEYSEDSTRDNFYVPPDWNPEISIKSENQQESDSFTSNQSPTMKPKSGEKKFCEICNKSFSRKFFSRHLQTVHPTDGDLIKKSQVFLF